MTYRKSQEASHPNESSIDLMRTSIAQIWPDDPVHKEWLATYASTHLTRLSFDLEMVQNFTETGQGILEIGAAPLFLTMALSNIGHKIDAVDLAPERFSQALKTLGLNIVKCNIETTPLPFEDSSYSLVLFNEMFEHMRINLIFTMREILRVLRPGGVLLLSTPNGRSLNHLKNYLLHGRTSEIYSEYDKLLSLGHMGHVREYTSKDIITFLEQVGFCVKELVYRGGYSLWPKHALELLLPRLRPCWLRLWVVCGRFQPLKLGATSRP